MAGITEILSIFAERLQQIVLVFGIALSLLQCFLGYRLLKLWVSLAGFGIGFLAGFILSSLAITDESYLPAAIGIGAGVLLAFAAFKLYLAGVFLYCGITVFFAIRSIPLGEAQPGQTILLIVAACGAVIAGILAVKFSRTIIIFFTAISGAMSAVHALHTPLPALFSNQTVSLLLIAAIAAVGILTQLKTTGQGKSRRR